MWDITKSPNLLSIGKDEGNDIKEREENIPHTKERKKYTDTKHTQTTK